MTNWLPCTPYPPAHCRVAFYVPSKIKNGSIAPVNRAKLLQAVRAALVTMFAGATEFEATGTFQGTTGLISESVTICYAFCTYELLGKYMKEINKLANSLAIDFEQDTIAVEVDGTMYQFAPTPYYRTRYTALKDKVTKGDAEKWGYDKWSEVELEDPNVRPSLTCDEQ